ncbi:general stress protein [Flavobacteriaceae bacterium JJC]|uniref:pyridoxamine 5'-phosphate oxidase family protein n=1 Tax=Kaistella soli TaxID=2849654 RepID=UPI000B4BE650|nr:pyridoxamine 5'-phosphate oxidase family protein [Kaistella soli]MBU8882849.1 pyridoxamine 5'-phosphate oxidase family protein [Kaistella soli]OWK73627.1 general stress protein [Flavobacteriaceae bacterium JJC]
MSTENLTQKEAIEKLKQLSEKAGTCMFCTDLTTLPITARPMSVRETDEEGNLWFLSSADSHKNFEISEDNRVQLLFMNNTDYEYLSVFGKAFIYKDKSLIEEKWTPIANAWFEDGKEDPKVSVIRVTPDETYYWDTKAGKVVSFLTFAAAAITGKKTDNSDGVEGNLDI